MDSQTTDAVIPVDENADACSSGYAARAAARIRACQRSKYLTARITHPLFRLDPAGETRGERGHLVLIVLGMVAQVERRFIDERQSKGIARARGDGADTGGKRRLERDRIRAPHAAGSGPAVIAREVGGSRMKVYRVLPRAAGDLIPAVKYFDRWQARMRAAARAA